MTSQKMLFDDALESKTAKNGKTAAQILEQDILLSSDVAFLIGVSCGCLLKVARRAKFPNHEGITGKRGSNDRGGRGCAYWLRENIVPHIENYNKQKTKSPVKQVATTKSDLLSAASLGEELGISTHSLRKLVSCGKIPSPVKINKSLCVWKRSDLIKAGVLDR